MRNPTFIIQDTTVLDYKPSLLENNKFTQKWFTFKISEFKDIVELLKTEYNISLTHSMKNELDQKYEHPYLELNEQVQFVKCIYPVSISHSQVKMESSYWLITQDAIISIGASKILTEALKVQISIVINEKLGQYVMLNMLFHCVADLYLKMLEEHNYSLTEWRKYYIKERHLFDEWGELADLQDSIRKQSLMAKLQLEYTEKFQDHYTDNQSLRHIHQRFERLTNYYESLEDKISSSLEMAFILQESRSNRILKLLALVSGLFLPLMFITGVFGMNFADMPFLNNHWSFYILMIFFVVMSLGLYVLFKIRKWL
jgi:Mg2+ and Co2+ transporter CorA